MSDIRITPRLWACLPSLRLVAQANHHPGTSQLNAWSGVASSPEMIGNVGHGFSMSQPIVHGLSVDLTALHVSFQRPWRGFFLASMNSVGAGLWYTPLSASTHAVRPWVGADWVGKTKRFV